MEIIIMLPLLLWMIMTTTMKLITMTAINMMTISVVAIAGPQSASTKYELLRSMLQF
jgi:hypothetical protein